MHQKTACQEIREPPSNGNNEDLSSQSKSVDKGKDHDGGKKKKPTTSKSTRSSRSSWKDDIQFDAKEQVLTIGKVHSYFWHVICKAIFVFVGLHVF